MKKKLAIILATAAAAVLSTSVWAGETKSFRIATDTVFKPFEFPDESGKQIGIDMEIVDIGQMEASRSLGLSYWRSMRLVVLPQAIRMMIPSIINQFIITLKDTSILSVIGFPELVNRAKGVVANTFMSFETWAIVAVMYLIVILTLSRCAKVLERKLSHA